MKVLITGARGQVGSALCRLAEATAITPIGLDSSQLDITDMAAVGAAFAAYEPDFVVNAAAYTAVDKAESEPDKAAAVNATGPANLAAKAAQHGVPLLHISTDYVFDGQQPGAYDEASPVAPLGAYGRTKLDGEKAVTDAHEQNIILRTSWVFALEGGNFPKTMLRLAGECLSGERDKIAVVADQMGCPSFADDIAAAILGIVRQFEQQGKLPWGIYHYCGAEACSWHAFAEHILQRAAELGVISSKPQVAAITTEDFPTPAPRPGNSVMSCTKFQQSFPGLPLSDWKAGVESLLKISGKIA